MKQMEQALHEKGFRYIAGVDEVGRGSETLLQLLVFGNHFEGVIGAFVSVFADKAVVFFILSELFESGSKDDKIAVIGNGVIPARSKAKPASAAAGNAPRTTNAPAAKYPKPK